MKLLELKQLLKELDTIQKPKEPRYIAGMSMDMWAKVGLEHQKAMEAYAKRRKDLEDTEV